MDTNDDSEINPLIDSRNPPQDYSGNNNNNTTTTAAATATTIVSACTIPTPTGRTTFNMAFIFYLFATLGVLLFSGTVWYIMWGVVDYFFFVWHPTLMALTIFMVTNGILALQQTVTSEEKSSGLNWHRSIQTISLLCVIGGFYVTFTFKNMQNKEHFTTPHGISGLTTVILLTTQAVGGGVLINFPGLVGGVARAKSFYKYHRMSGYFILFLIYLTALGGTQSEWTKEQFDHLWVWFSAIGLVLVGIIGRTKSNKLKVR